MKRSFKKCGLEVLTDGRYKNVLVDTSSFLGSFDMVQLPRAHTKSLHPSHETQVKYYDQRIELFDYWNDSFLSNLCLRTTQRVYDELSHSNHQTKYSDVIKSPAVQKDREFLYLARLIEKHKKHLRSLTNSIFDNGRIIDLSGDITPYYPSFEEVCRSFSLDKNDQNFVLNSLLLAEEDGDTALISQDLGLLKTTESLRRLKKPKFFIHSYSSPSFGSFRAFYLSTPK